MPDPEALLRFWFGTLVDGVADATYRDRWFAGGVEFDDACQNQFGHWLSEDRSSWLNSPRQRLAYILLYDQIPRNIHRGSDKAFAWDELALAAAREGVEQQADRELGWDERSFFYMPFEHSEALMDQHIAVGLFSQLRDESPKPLRQQTGNTLRFAQQHRDVIQRFGRFPHRNTSLKRESTAEELEFIARGDGWGQVSP